MTADILATWRPSHVLMRGATERGKTYPTAKQAVRGLLSYNGCTNIQIEG